MPRRRRKLFSMLLFLYFLKLPGYWHQIILLTPRTWMGIDLLGPSLRGRSWLGGEMNLHFGMASGAGSFLLDIQGTFCCTTVSHNST
mmetsp:Transcript_75319/g.125584  ORF Transcript_75319/g.125584 Transcript_75319/m.125584 type:complete len:87 (+) Transcript_75319:240-500(+)